MTERARHAGLALTIALLLCVPLFFQRTPLLADETTHAAQVRRFLAGNFALYPQLTTVPGYHFILFFLAKLTGWHTNASLRLFSLLFGIGSVILVWRLTRSAYRLLLFVCLPIILPFFFLVYTDVASLCFVLLSLYLIQTRRYASAGFAAIAACLMRQNNVVWLVFLGTLAYVDRFGPTIDSDKKKWAERNLWPFAVGVALFLSLLLANRGNVSLGDFRSHPTGPLHMTNVWFMLFLFALLFLPFTAPRAVETLRRFRTQPLFWAGALAVFLFYLLTFTNSHSYNVQWGNYFIRNAILIFSTQTAAHKALFFIPVFIAIAALISTRLERPAHYLLYPASIFFLVPSWLVEQRYYMIPFTLFLVFAGPFFPSHTDGARPLPETIIDWTWAALSIAACVALLILVAKGRAFL